MSSYRSQRSRPMVAARSVLPAGFVISLLLVLTRSRGSMPAPLRAGSARRPHGRLAFRLSTVVAVLLSTAVLASVATAASAPPTTSAVFTGGAGTVSNGGILYAKNTGALTLAVTTSADTKCVQVTGAHAAKQTSTNAKSSWTFTFTAGAGDGVQTVTAAASPSFNGQGSCTGGSNSGSASYVLDNTGPVVTAARTPPANGAGWNNSNVTIGWSASDGAGSGVATGPTPATDSVTSATARSP
jgi:hypothetical protein